jgi:hypothetical protein
MTFRSDRVLIWLMRGHTAASLYGYRILLLIPVHNAVRLRPMLTHPELSNLSLIYSFVIDLTSSVLKANGDRPMKFGLLPLKSRFVSSGARQQVPPNNLGAPP